MISVERNNPSHAELVDRAVRWLTNSAGCSVAFSELSTGGSWEIPDALGFNCWSSVIVECKCSRSDFRADAGKPFRRNPYLGMGHRRYCMVPDGMILPNEVQDGWGLLYVKGSRVHKIRDSSGFAARSRSGEMSFLVSALRRTQERLGQPLNGWLKNLEAIA